MLSKYFLVRWPSESCQELLNIVWYEKTEQCTRNIPFEKSDKCEKCLCVSVNTRSMPKTPCQVSDKMNLFALRKNGTYKQKNRESTIQLTSSTKSYIHMYKIYTYKLDNTHFCDFLLSFSHFLKYQVELHITYSFTQIYVHKRSKTLQHLFTVRVQINQGCRSIKGKRYTFNLNYTYMHT